MRISDWSSDVCSSDLDGTAAGGHEERYGGPAGPDRAHEDVVEGVGPVVVGAVEQTVLASCPQPGRHGHAGQRTERVVSLSEHRSEEHTSELQSLMRNSYAVFCFKKKKLRPTEIELQIIRCTTTILGIHL